MHHLLSHILTSPGPTLPLILDEDMALECISAYSHIQVTSLEECTTGNIPWVRLYEKSQEKKSLSIEDIRRWIVDIAERPYEKRVIYILRAFDEASHEAMNATLKILEEPPDYAIILLVVSNPESLLETIRSRTINIWRWHSLREISEEVRWYINTYLRGDPTWLIRYTYSGKIDREEVLSMLTTLARHANSEQLALIEEAIIALFWVNETPRNILDRVILSPLP